MYLAYSWKRSRQQTTSICHLPTEEEWGQIDLPSVQQCLQCCCYVLSPPLSSPIILFLSFAGSQFLQRLCDETYGKGVPHQLDARFTPIGFTLERCRDLLSYPEAWPCSAEPPGVGSEPVRGARIALQSFAGAGGSQGDSEKRITSLLVNPTTHCYCGGLGSHSREDQRQREHLQTFRFFSPVSHWWTVFAPPLPALPAAAMEQQADLLTPTSLPCGKAAALPTTECRLCF